MTDIAQAVRRAMNGLKMLLGRGRVQLTDDSGPVQLVQVKMSANEVMDIVRLSEFGFASRIPKDGDVAAIFLNAERTWGIVVASGHQQFRFKLENDGETAIYDAFGKSIWFKKESMVVEAGGKPITINGANGITINSTEKLIINMGGKDVQIENPGQVYLGGKAGAKKVALDGDPVVGGVVQSTATKVWGK